MTDKNLYEHIRKLVREQKDQQCLDVRQENFAQEYCRFEMLKKRQTRPQENRMNNLLKNFKNVESYINIMDIIRNLQLSLAAPTTQHTISQDDQLPQIIPKSLQLKIREELAPILSKRYEEESLKRAELVRSLKENLSCSNSQLVHEDGLLQELIAALDSNKLTERFELIDVLRKDIKMKQVYFIERRFDKEIDDIGRLPKKLEDTKLFHKICSYLHMVLEQQHKEKWASKQEQRFREDHRKTHLRRKMRIPTLIRDYSDSLRRTTSNFHHSRLQSSFYKENIEREENQIYRTTVNSPHKNAHFEDDEAAIIEEESSEDQPPKESFKKVQSKQELVKETFTFRKRGIKAGLMSRINQFVENLTDEEKKNVQASKKYGKALQSLAEELETSYGRFKREQLAQEEDIQDMKKYLDNTLSRNKKDLKKFHHK